MTNLKVVLILVLAALLASAWVLSFYMFEDF